MPNYTVTTRQIVQANIDIFDFDYPLFDEKYRAHFEKMIIDNFMFREIGFETINRFKFELETRLNLIMPFYNQRYASTLLEFDPLINYDLTENYTRLINGSSDSKNLFSDTPQGRITIDKNYVTTIAQDNGSSKNDETYQRNARGNIGVQTSADLLNAFRTTFINVDKEVLKELNDLFMLIY